MISMDLVGKIETEFEIKSPVDKFHQVLWRKPHCLPSVSPSVIQKVELLQGECGTQGFVINCHYVTDGNGYAAKGIIEAKDGEEEDDKTIIFSVIEGDLMNEYKKYKIIIKATEKGTTTSEGGVRLVHWTVEYEKQKEDILPPNKIFEFAFNITMDIDDHLVQA